MHKRTSQFLPLDALASTLGLPRDWLREQADSQRIPCLRVNGRRLFDPELVRCALVERMSQPDCQTEGAMR